MKSGAEQAATDLKVKITFEGPETEAMVDKQIDMLSATGKGAICQIELTVSSSGLLEGVQIKGDVSNKAIDTGLVRRPEAPTPPPVPADGAAEVAPLRPLNATDEMIAEVFVNFDTEMKKVTEAKGSLRSDLFSRIAGNTVKSADLAAGLRHNLNLMLQNVSR